ncbi:hypothetical protein J8I87_27420 [Paraburkholderia sp. LEh10]|uniref:hypothetical protein n=1 Tax=Paraburkholderia sp. LEh10 TaxID=2821353 RepID=UPI001AE5195E|nr:hypothetical protein [Paraburkholderia sp. LEh10]MBP0593363.1 hypothetical protein [Paraburkholderia sp. LEh10]
MRNFPIINGRFALAAVDWSPRLILCSAVLMAARVRDEWRRRVSVDAPAYALRVVSFDRPLRPVVDIRKRLHRIDVRRAFMCHAGATSQLPWGN